MPSGVIRLRHSRKNHPMPIMQYKQTDTSGLRGGHKTRRSSQDFSAEVKPQKAVHRGEGGSKHRRVTEK